MELPVDLLPGGDAETELETSLPFARTPHSIHFSIAGFIGAPHAAQFSGLDMGCFSFNGSKARIESESETGE